MIKYLQTKVLSLSCADVFFYVKRPPDIRSGMYYVPYLRLGVHRQAIKVSFQKKSACLLARRKPYEKSITSQQGSLLIFRIHV